MRRLLRVTTAATALVVGGLLPGSNSHLAVSASASPQLVPSNLERPTAMAIDPHGNVYVVVYGQCGLYDSIVKLSPQGQVLERLEFTFGSGPGQFKAITGVAADAAGNIYATDLLNNRVQKLSPAGVPLASWYGGQNGTQRLSYPLGLTVDQQGNVDVVDSSAERVVRFSPSGAVLSTLKTGYRPPFDIPLTPDLQDPLFPLGLTVTTLLAGVAVGPHGDIYVATGDDVRRLSPNGTLLGKWRPPFPARGLRQAPRSIAVDADGNMYTTGDVVPIHQQFGVVEIVRGPALGLDKLSPSGKLLALWAEPDRRPGGFAQATGVSVDGAGDLYVADMSLSRVQKLSPHGSALAVWGDVRTASPAPGRFGFGVAALAVGSHGRVLATTGVPERVDVLSPRGRVRARWNPVARFAVRYVAGLATDPSGNIYLGDQNGGGVIQISPRGRLLQRWRLPRHPSSDPYVFAAPQVDGIAVAPWGEIYVTAEGDLWSSPRASNRWKIIVTRPDAIPGPPPLSTPAIDPQRRVYAIAGYRRVDVFSPAGSLLGRRTVSETCAGVAFTPMAIAAGPRGTLYVADGDPTDQVLQFSRSGRLLGRWGGRGEGPGQFEFYTQVGLAVGPRGNVFVADNTGRIQKFSPAGRLLSVWR